MNAKTDKTSKKYLYSEFYDRMVGILTGKKDVGSKKILTEDEETNIRNIFSTDRFDEVFDPIVTSLRQEEQDRAANRAYDAESAAYINTMVAYIYRCFPALYNLALGADRFLDLVKGASEKNYAIENEFKDPTKNPFVRAKNAMLKNDNKVMAREYIMAIRKINIAKNTTTDETISDILGNDASAKAALESIAFQLNPIRKFIMDGIVSLSVVVNWYIEKRETLNVASMFLRTIDGHEAFMYGNGKIESLITYIQSNGEVTVDFLAKTLREALYNIGKIYSAISEMGFIGSVPLEIGTTPDEDRPDQQLAKKDDEERENDEKERLLTREELFNEMELADDEIEQTADELGRSIRMGLRIYFDKKNFNETYEEGLLTDVREMLKLVANIRFSKKG